MRPGLCGRGALPSARAVTRVALVATLVAALTDATVAAADPERPTDDEKAAARVLGSEGARLAMGGDCAGAVDKLVQAEALAHAPTTAVPLAQCQIQQGKIIAGTELLIRVLNESLPPNAPQPWIDARKRAQPILDAAQPRIARIRVHVERPRGPGPSLEGLHVTIDGDTLPLVLLDNDRPTDPGSHHLAATQEGLTTAEADVSLAEGQTQAVTLELDPVAAGGPPVPPAQTPGGPGATTAAPVDRFAPGSPPPPVVGPSRAPALVAYCIGGAGAIVGTAFGIAALAAKSNLDSECSGKICPTSAQADIGGLHTDAIFSTVGWGIAASGALVGTILMLTATPAGSPQTAHAGVRPWLGPGAAGLTGSFR
jgi:hypothetical protein